MVDRASSLDALLQRVMATHNSLIDGHDSVDDYFGGSTNDRRSGDDDDDDDAAINDLLARMGGVSDERISNPIIDVRDGLDADESLLNVVSPPPRRSVFLSPQSEETPSRSSPAGASKVKKSKKDKRSGSAEEGSAASPTDKKGKKKGTRSRRQEVAEEGQDNEIGESSSPSPRKEKKGKKEKAEKKPKSAKGGDVVRDGELDIQQGGDGPKIGVTIESTLFDERRPVVSEALSNASSRASSVASTAGAGLLIDSPDEAPPHAVDAGSTRYVRVDTLEWLSSVMVWRYAGLATEEPIPSEAASLLPPLEEVASSRVFIFIPDALVAASELIATTLRGTTSNGDQDLRRRVCRTLLQHNATLAYRAKFDPTRRRFYFLQLADKGTKGWRLPDLASTAVLQAPFSSFNPTADKKPAHDEESDESAQWLRLASCSTAIRDRWEGLQRKSYWGSVRCGSLLREAVATMENARRREAASNKLPTTPPPPTTTPTASSTIPTTPLVGPISPVHAASSSALSSRRSSRVVSFCMDPTADDSQPPIIASTNHQQHDLGFSAPLTASGLAVVEPEARSTDLYPRPHRRQSPSPVPEVNPPPTPQLADQFPFMVAAPAQSKVQPASSNATPTSAKSTVSESHYSRRIADLRFEMEDVVVRAGRVPPPRSIAFAPTPNKRAPPTPAVSEGPTAVSMPAVAWTSRTQLNYMMLSEDERNQRQHVEDDALMFTLQVVKPLWRMACVEQKERFGRERLLLWELAEASKQFLFFSPTTAELSSATLSSGGSLDTASVVSLTSTMNSLMNFIYTPTTNVTHRLQARHAGAQSQKTIPHYNFKPGFFGAAPAFVPYIAMRSDTILAGRMEEAMMETPSGSHYNGTRPFDGVGGGALPVEYVRLFGTQYGGSPAPSRSRLLGQTSFDVTGVPTGHDDPSTGGDGGKQQTPHYFDRLYAPLANPYPAGPAITCAGSLEQPLAGISAICFRSSYFLFLYALWQDIKHEEVYSRKLLLRDALHDITGAYGSQSSLAKMSMVGASGTPTSAVAPTIGGVKPPLVPQTSSQGAAIESSRLGSEFLHRQNVVLEESEERAALHKRLRQECDLLHFDSYWTNKAVAAALAEVELEELSRRGRMLRSEGTLRDGIRALFEEALGHLQYFNSVVQQETYAPSAAGANIATRRVPSGNGESNVAIARELLLEDVDLGPTSPYFAREGNDRDNEVIQRSTALQKGGWANQVGTSAPQRRESNEELELRLEEDIRRQLGIRSPAGHPSGLNDGGDSSWPLSAGYNVFVDRGYATPIKYAPSTITSPFTQRSLGAPSSPATASATSGIVKRAVEGAIRRFVVDANHLLIGYQDAKVDLLSRSAAAVTAAALQHRLRESHIDRMYKTSEASRTSRPRHVDSSNLQLSSINKWDASFSVRDGPSVTSRAPSAATSTAASQKAPSRTASVASSLVRGEGATARLPSVASNASSLAEGCAMRDAERKERIRLWKEGKINRLSEPLENGHSYLHSSKPPPNVGAKQHAPPATDERSFLAELARRKLESVATLNAHTQSRLRTTEEAAEVELRNYAYNAAHPLLEASPTRRRTVSNDRRYVAAANPNATRHDVAYADEIARQHLLNHERAVRIHSDRVSSRFVATPCVNFADVSSAIPLRPSTDSILRTRPHARALVIADQMEQISHKVIGPFSPLSAGVAMWRDRIYGNEKEVPVDERKRQKRMASALARDSLIDLGALRGAARSHRRTPSSSSSSTSSFSSTTSTSSSSSSRRSTTNRRSGKVVAQQSTSRRSSRLPSPPRSEPSPSSLRRVSTSLTSNPPEQYSSIMTSSDVVSVQKPRPKPNRAKVPVRDGGSPPAHFMGAFHESQSSLSPPNTPQLSSQPQNTTAARPVPINQLEIAANGAVATEDSAVSIKANLPHSSRCTPEPSTPHGNHVARTPSNSNASVVSRGFSRVVSTLDVAAPPIHPERAPADAPAQNDAAAATGPTHRSDGGDVGVRRASTASELARKIRLDRKLRGRDVESSKLAAATVTQSLPISRPVTPTLRQTSPGPTEPHDVNASPPIEGADVIPRGESGSVTMSLSTVRDPSPTNVPTHYAAPEFVGVSDIANVVPLAGASVSRASSSKFDVSRLGSGLEHPSTSMFGDASEADPHHFASPATEPQASQRRQDLYLSSSPVHHHIGNPRPREPSSSAHRHISEEPPSTVLKWELAAVESTYKEQLKRTSSLTSFLSTNPPTAVVPVEVSEGGVGLRRVEPPFAFAADSNNTSEEVEDTFRALCAFRRERPELLHNMRLTLVYEALGELNRAEMGGQGYRGRDDTPSLSGAASTTALSFHTMSSQDQQEMLQWAGEQDEFRSFSNEVDEEEAALVSAISKVPPPRPLLAFGLGSIGVSSGLFIYEIRLRLVITPARVQRYREIRRASNLRTGAPSAAGDVSYDELKQRPSRATRSASNRSVSPQRSHNVTPSQHSLLRSPSAASDASHMEVYSPNPNHFPSSSTRTQRSNVASKPDPTFGQEGAPITFAGYNDDGLDALLPFSLMCAVGFCTEAFKVGGKTEGGLLQQRGLGAGPPEELAGAYLMCEDGSLSLNAHNSVVDVVRDGSADAQPRYFSRGHGFGDDFLHRARLSAPTAPSSNDPPASTLNRSMSILMGAAAPATVSTTDSIECTVTAILDLHAKELSFVVNGVPQGTAFQFSPPSSSGAAVNPHNGVDEDDDGETGGVEPLFPLVLLAEEGDEAWLVKPSV